MSLVKKLASVVVTGSLVFGLVGTAFAAPAPDKVAEGANRLHALGIVNGSDAAHPDNLQLDQQITRAQLMKIMVWAFGQKDNAAILKGAQAFPDTASHWASGEIAIAKNIIVERNHASMGMPDGTFDPEGKVTNAQAVAFLMKFIGVNPDNSKSWPANYLDAAVAAGLLSASDVESISPIANNPATRGIVFYLADAAFSSYNLGNGKTVYTTYVKPNAPVLNVEAPVANTTEKSLTISGSVGSDAVSLTVNGTTVTPAADGKFTADVALTVGPNPITVVATDVVKGSTTKTFSVARTVGAAANINVASATVTVAAGESVDFNATISDKDGNVIDAAQADVTSDVGSFDHGKFTAGTAAKDGTITVKYGDLTPVTVNVSVKAGALDKLVISPATLDLNSNATQKFTAAGADAYGNAVDISNVAWSASKGVMGTDGTFGATADATGTVTVTATAGGKSGTATVNVFGAASKVQVATPATIVANGESEVTVTATVLDGAGNVAKTYNGNVTFSSSNSSVKVETATVAAVNGVATTTLKSGGASTTTAVVSASASGLTGTTVTVTPAAQAATSVKVTASPSTLATGTQGTSTGTLTLKLQDQTGNDMLAYPTGSKQITVRLSVGDDGSVLNFGAATTTYTDVTFDAVSKTATIYATPKVGAGTVTGTVTAPSGSAVTVSSVSLSTLIVGSAYQLKVDAIDSAKAGATDQLATIRVLDFNGNQLTTNAGSVSNITVKRVDADGNSTTISSTASTSNGKGSLNVNTTTAGTYTLKVSATGLASAPDVTYSVTPTDAAKLAIAASPTTIQANGTSQSTLTVKVQDQYSNLVTDGSYTVTLKKSSGTATATFADTTLTTNNGVATAVVTATTNQGTDHFTVTGDKLTGNGIDVSTAIMGAPYELGIHTGYSTVTGAAGDSITVKVDVKDAAHTLLSYDNGRTVTVTVKDGTTVVGTFTGTTTNGVASISTNLTTAKTSYSFEATADGLAKVSGGTLTVTPASATAVKVSADRTSMAASASSQAKITVSLADAYGNTVTPSSNTDVFVKVTSASPTADFPAGAKVATGDNAGWVKLTITAGATSASTVDSTSSLVGTAAAGSNTITAHSGTLTDATLTVSTVVTGSASALTIDTISDTTASNSTTPTRQTIVITLVDGAGNPITSDSTHTVSLDSISGSNGTVNYYVYDLSAGTWGTASATKPSGVTLYKGQAKIGVIDTKADSLTYNFTSNVVSGTKSVSGNFVPGTASKVVVNTSDPAFINGNGLGITTVTATVADALDNTVTTANGTVTFAIKTGSDFATLLSDSASLVNGVASVAAQSKYVTSDGQVTITAKYDLDADGDYTDANETVDGLAFTVDGTTPAAALTLSTEAVAGTLNSVVAPAFGATVTNSGAFPSAVASVQFDYRDDTANGTWIDLGTDAASPYAAAAISGFLTDGHVYVFRATVTDAVGRSAQFTKTVTVTDTTAPTATAAVTKDSTAGVSAGDKIVVSFSEPTVKPTLAASDFSFSGTNDTFGTANVGFAWNDAGTQLTITLGTGAQLTDTKTVSLTAAGAAKITDTSAAHNAFAAGVVYTIAATDF